MLGYWSIKLFFALQYYYVSLFLFELTLTFILISQ